MQLRMRALGTAAHWVALWYGTPAAYCVTHSSVLQHCGWAAHNWACRQAMKRSVCSGPAGKDEATYIEQERDD